jgi:hypothetical protein
MARKEKERDSSKSTLKEKLADDPLFLKYKELMTQSGLDIEKALASLEKLHKNRYFRDLTSPSQARLVKPC